MKKKSLFPILIITALFLSFIAASSDNKEQVQTKYNMEFEQKKAKSESDTLKIIVKSYYRNRPDGKPGRELSLVFNDFQNNHTNCWGIVFPATIK